MDEVWDVAVQVSTATVEMTGAMAAQARLAATEVRDVLTDVWDALGVCRSLCK
jgi:hypothetical protein